MKSLCINRAEAFKVKKKPGEDLRPERCRRVAGKCRAKSEVDEREAGRRVAHEISRGVADEFARAGVPAGVNRDAKVVVFVPFRIGVKTFTAFAAATVLRI